MIRVMWLKLSLVILIWKSNEMIQQEEKVLEQDISVIQLPALAGRLVTGLVECGKGDKYETLSQVKKIMDEVITNASTYTKNTLMKYVRDNFKGNAHIKDVGKVVPKIIKEQLTGSGKWESVTKKRYIRLRQKG